MICISRRRRRISLCPAFSKSPPSKETVPDVGSISRRISRPSVLFPDPDSPTSPSVSPECMSSETSSTARTSPFDPPNADSPRGKTFIRLRTSISGTILSFVCDPAHAIQDQRKPLLAGRVGQHVSGQGLQKITILQQCTEFVAQKLPQFRIASAYFVRD